MLQPSLNLFKQRSEIDREIAELSLISSRRAFWEVFICVMGYSGITGKDPNQILADIPFRQIQRHWVWLSSDPFLRYCEQFKLGPREEFLPAAYVITLALAQESLVTNVSFVEKFEECYRRCNGAWDCVDKCLKE